MRLEEQLTELLAGLGVVMEGQSEETVAERAESEISVRYSFGTRRERDDMDTTEDSAEELAANIAAVAELSLFQTSREHYGVFYRLDLVEGAPQLRIFLPDDEGSVKMRCYFVRAAVGTPLHEWFVTAREHEGSPAYEDARDVAQQHLLFAAGELMKRLFWTGDLEQMRFPAEIEAVRLM
ncbi:MAG: hypothetical protein ACRDHP_07510 [Ktedonobacterales bacterium]